MDYGYLPYTPENMSIYAEVKWRKVRFEGKSLFLVTAELG